MSNRSLTALPSYLSVVVLALLLSGCFDSKRVWIVVELMTPDGQTASMAFNNPAVPDITLKECEDSIEASIPTLMEAIKSEPRMNGSVFKSAKCVESIDDPIKSQK